MKDRAREGGSARVVAAKKSRRWKKGGKVPGKRVKKVHAVRRLKNVKCRGEDQTRLKDIVIFRKERRKTRGRKG